LFAVHVPFLFDDWLAFCDARRWDACDVQDFNLAVFWRDERDYGYEWYLGQEIELTVSGGR
jgi:hypothetical protein